jgi:hypothetical protein
MSILEGSKRSGVSGAIIPAPLILYADEFGSIFLKAVFCDKTAKEKQQKIKATTDFFMSATLLGD